MTNKENGQHKDDGDRLFHVAGLLLLTMIGNHIWNRIAPWYHAHDFQIIAMTSVILTAGIAVIISYAWNTYVERIDYERSITAASEDAVFLGKDKKGRDVFLKEQFRTLHAQVIGTTSAGKTESVILPWAIRDVERGSGLLIIDGKADTSFLNKLYSHIVENGRKKDFRFFSLAHVANSWVFNPLAAGSPEEVTERVFSSFKIENEYYRSIQYQMFLSALHALKAAQIPPSMLMVKKLLTQTDFLESTLSLVEQGEEIDAIAGYSKMPPEKRWELTSGLTSTLNQFASGDCAVIFNGDGPRINFEEALSESQILYFQLPTMLYPVLGEAAGKLTLQSFQAAVANPRSFPGS